MKIRHEYRTSFGEGPKTSSLELSSNFKVRNPTESDAPELAELMLDAYRGTIDYDGETTQEATSEVESYLRRIDSKAMLSCSFVAVSEGHIVSACLVSKWENPVAEGMRCGGSMTHNSHVPSRISVTVS